MNVPVATQHENRVTGHTLRIGTFGGLSVQGPRAPTGWIPSARQRQLLRWLVLARWGPPLEITTVCDAMWPCADGAAAASNFASTVRRLRQALRQPAAIVIQRGLLGLHPDICSTDLDLFAEGPHHPLASSAPVPAKAFAHRLLLASDRINPVLEIRPDCREMAQRVHAVGSAWRQATLHLCHVLEGAGQLPLALRLCERIDRHGWADDRILQQCQHLSSLIRSNPCREFRNEPDVRRRFR